MIDMCNEQNRRAFLKKMFTLNVGAVLATSSLGSLELFLPRGIGLRSLLTSAKKTYSQLAHSTPFDKVDRKPDYLEGTDMVFWHRQIHPIFERLVPSLGVPAHGVIMEMGVYKGDSFALLTNLFGADRVRGIELVKYIDEPRILNIDVRSLTSEHDMPLAIAWNDVSNWKGSPRSKMAALNYARKNLVLGGLYIDESLADLPSDLPLSDFKLVHSEGDVSVFRRIRIS